MFGRLFFLILLYPICLTAVDIALTIDDYPMDDGVIFSAEQRTQAFINALEKHNSKAAFFCIGDHCLSEKGSSLLSQLDKSGHFLCNHSMQHTHLSSQSMEAFEGEIKQVEAILRPYNHMRKWYRFPFLDYGNRISIGGSCEKASQALQILDRLGYSEGYVTMNTFDWHLNDRLSAAIEKGFSVDYQALKNLYIELLQSWCEYYIRFYEGVYPEKITHTLLLHANDLNALFLHDILNMLKDSGWNVVSPEKAFSDVSWRKEILKNYEIITHKPLNLDCLEIDRQILQNNIFYKD